MLRLLLFLPVYLILFNLSAGLLLVTLFRDQISGPLLKYLDSSYTLSVIYLASFAIIGFIILVYFYRKLKNISLAGTLNYLSHSRNTRHRVQLFLPYINLLIIVVFYVNYSSYLYDRDVYIPNFGLGPGFFTLTAPVLVGFQKRGLLAHLYLFFVILFAFALSTRSSALVPVIFLSTRVAVNRTPPTFPRTIYVLLIPILYFLALINRNYPRHGLLTYFQNLFKSLSDITDNIAFWVSEAVYNVGTSLLILSATLDDKSKIDFGWNYAKVVLSPFSGQTVGWHDIYLNYRLHLFIPYSGIGEIININIFLSVGLLAFLFYLYGSSLVSFLTNVNGFSKALNGLVLLFSFAAFIFMFQYNARSFMRFVWIAAALRLFSYALKSFLPYRKKAGASS
jgi:hypothetical protein